MSEQKSRFISDTIHGTIQISYLEKELISTQAFNRLHNILQNSTVYLTYPSNQTKRFSHSLGTMHLCGQIFLYSLVNADSETRDEFLQTANQAIEEITKDDDVLQILNRSLGENNIKILDNIHNIQLNEPLYKINTPNIIPQKYIFAYQVIYQSARCVALLHDVGHPPFSHITEFALKEVLRHINSIDHDKRTNRQKSFIDSLNSANNDELHEKIGYTIASRLMGTIIPEKNPSTKTDAEKFLFYILVQRIVRYILNDENAFYQDIHNIISGAIDCDRLDYVNRDLINSGFNYGQIEYDRLITSMKLIKHNNRFHFCASLRTLSTIEDFFRRRLTLYKFIIYHHRVVKTDYLLGNILVALSLDYLNKNDEEDEDIDNNNQVLPLNISGLWKAVKHVYSNKDYFNAIIQWDDSWLITVLRKQFFEHYQDKNNDNIISCQLEELLSNRKYYRSMIKKMDDFLIVDNSILDNFTYNWDVILDVVGDMFTNIILSLKDHMENKDHKSGFFLSKIILLFFDLMEIDIREKISSSVEKVADRYKAKDCIVVFKKIKTGLEKDAYAYKQNETIALDDVSNIDLELRQSCMVFPTFFVYLREAEGIDQNDFLRDIGKSIAIELKSLLNNIVPSDNILPLNSE